nr:MAG TPA: hypothetical protein [Caudoviricetes sp.]
MSSYSKWTSSISTFKSQLTHNIIICRPLSIASLNKTIINKRSKLISKRLKLIRLFAIWLFNWFHKHYFSPVTLFFKAVEALIFSL